VDQRQQRLHATFAERLEPCPHDLGVARGHTGRVSLRSRVTGLRTMGERDSRFATRRSLRRAGPGLESRS
jgi:hypothetical protein